MKVLRDAVVAAEAVERKYEAPADVRAAFAALPKAADEVGATLVAREAKFSRLAVDNEAVKRYKALSDTIARQERELRDSTHESSKAQSEFSQRLNEFDSDLDHEIRQINVHFVEGMARIQCRGEVKTSLGDVSAGSGRRPVHPSLEAPVPASLPPSQDIEEKSLIVKVAYRKDEEMKQLSALSQSGGERVVATMLYMLALQVRRGCGSQGRRMRAGRPPTRARDHCPRPPPGDHAAALPHRRRDQPGHGREERACSPREPPRHCAGHARGGCHGCGELRRGRAAAARQRPPALHGVAQAHAQPHARAHHALRCRLQRAARGPRCVRTRMPLGSARVLGSTCSYFASAGIDSSMRLASRVLALQVSRGAPELVRPQPRPTCPAPPPHPAQSVALEPKLGTLDWGEVAEDAKKADHDAVQARRRAVADSSSAFGVAMGGSEPAEDAVPIPRR